MGEWIDAILIQKQGRCWLLLHNIRLNAALLSCRRSFCLWLTSMLRSCRRHANEPNISSFPSCITQTAQHPRQLGGAPSMLNTQSIHAVGLAPPAFQSFRPFPQEAFSQTNVIFPRISLPERTTTAPKWAALLTSSDSYAVTMYTLPILPRVWKRDSTRREWANI